MFRGRKFHTKYEEALKFKNLLWIFFLLKESKLFFFPEESVWTPKCSPKLQLSSVLSATYKTGWQCQACLDNPMDEISFVSYVSFLANNRKRSCYFFHSLFQLSPHISKITIWFSSSQNSLSHWVSEDNFEDMAGGHGNCFQNLTADKRLERKFHMSSSCWNFINPQN